MSSRGKPIELNEENVALIEKIEMIDQVATKDLQNQDIDEIGEYCL